MRSSVSFMFVLLFVATALIAPANAQALGPGGTFVDDDDSIFEADIEALAAAGVTKGCNTERTSFCPDANVTRGQMAAFLVRALSLTDSDPTIDFTDDNTSIFEADIEKLATAGITKGCNAERTEFCPDANVTRGQMAAFLVRALSLTDSDPTIDFTDDNTSIFEADIEKLATAGITKGCNAERTEFCPDANVTRGQMAAFLSRALKYPRISVPERGETTSGIDLALGEVATAQGCTFADGSTCNVAVMVDAGALFYIDEGFIAAPWSAIGAANQAAFVTNAWRVEAELNGTGLNLIATDPTVTNDVGEKLYTFQFPNTWTGTHELLVTFIRDDIGYESVIRATVVIDDAAA